MNDETVVWVWIFPRPNPVAAKDYLRNTLGPHRVTRESFTTRENRLFSSGPTRSTPVSTDMAF